MNTPEHAAARVLSPDFVQNGKLKMPRIFSTDPRLAAMMAAFLIHNAKTMVAYLAKGHVPFFFDC